MQPMTHLMARIKRILAQWERDNVAPQFEGGRVESTEGMFDDGAKYNTYDKQLPEELTADKAGWVEIRD